MGCDDPCRDRGDQGVQALLIQRAGQQLPPQQADPAPQARSSQTHVAPLQRCVWSQAAQAGPQWAASLATQTSLQHTLPAPQLVALQTHAPFLQSGVGSLQVVPQAPQLRASLAAQASPQQRRLLAHVPQSSVPPQPSDGWPH